MRTLLIMTALLAAVPAMAGGHRSQNADRSHATATRASRGAPATNRGAQSRSNTRAVQTRSGTRAVPARSGTRAAPVRSAPSRHVQTARPGPRTQAAPARRVQGHNNHRTQTRRVVHRDPWARGYRASYRPGHVWVAGTWTQAGWHPGYYRPVNVRAGHVWVQGYWDGYTYVDGYWRPVNRRGYVWTGGYYSGRTWIRGQWTVAPRGQRYYGSVYR